MISWNNIFRLGVLGLLVVVLFSLLTVGTFALGVEGSPISEGGSFSKLARVAGFWVYFVIGFILIVPSIASLRKTGNEFSSAARIAWTLFVLIFPFAGPYVYYALFCQSQTNQSSQ